jgi:hypothetical protein
MIETIRRRLISFAKTAPFELWPTLAILSGIVTFNREFVHIGFRQFYVTEVLLLGTLLAALLSALFSPQYHAILRGFCGRQFVLFHLLGIYAVVWLLAQHEQGLLAVRHSMMVFSAAFVVLFALAFASPGALAGTLRYLLVLSSTFNAAKILRSWMIGASMEDEPLRVAHNEVDVICASLSLVGLMVLSRRDGRRRWLLLGPLMVANLFILTLTVKRTAILGLLVALVLGAALSGHKRTRPRVVGIAAVAALLAAVVLALMNGGHAGPMAAFIANKFQFMTETNATWRLTAWHLAWQRFLEAPWLGIGYGLPILQSSLRHVRTADPHNSILAFFVRHGVVGGTLFLALIVQACVRYVRRIKSSLPGDERSLTLFFFLAFVYMVIFASFNVVLENQYEGIFFWFALSGAFILAAPGASTAGPSSSEGGAGQGASQGHAAFSRSPLTWIRGTALAGAVVYVLLIVSPWNYLPTIAIYTAARRAQVPLAETGRGTTVEVVSVRSGLQVDVDPRWPAHSAVMWALPENLTDDFRLQMPPREWWNRWLAVSWILPEDFTRSVRRGTDYAIVLELGSPDQAHKPYVFILEDIWGRRYQATGRAVGDSRVVSLREFETGEPVRWKDARHLHLQFPPAPRPLSLQVKSLSVARQADTLPPSDASLDVPTRACTAKSVLTRRTIADFETLDRKSGVEGFAFGAANDAGLASGTLWARDDGTGRPVVEAVKGAAATKCAIRTSNPGASGWGVALGVWLNCLDATAFHGVEFWVRGSTPTGAGRIAVDTRETTPPDSGYPDKGTCVGADPAYDCYAPHADFPVTGSWSKVRLAWADFGPGFNGSTLVMANGDNITGFSFAAQLEWKSEAAQARPGAVELAIDEISFF